MKRFATGSAFTLKGRQFQGLSGWEGKPFHPPLTDIPVGAYVIAPVLDIVAFAGREQTWGPNLHAAAGYALLAGAGFSLLTVLTGFADWLRMRAGSEVRRITNTHAITMVVVTVLVVSNLLVRFNDTSDVTTGGVLALSIATGVLVTVGAMIGGSLVYDKGYKVRARMTPPEERGQEQRRAS